MRAGWRDFGARVFGAIAMIAATSALAQGSAEPPGDAGRGETIARRWCAACHVVAADQTRAAADAPSFMAVAVRVGSPDSLKAFLADPHPLMPDMSLTRAEIADLTAYIVSFRR